MSRRDQFSVVCWKWTPRPGYRSKFGPETVNTLRSMVQRHFDMPHRFLCVTDDSRGLDPKVEVIPAWNDFADVPSPHGAENPSCYRRLRAFHPDIGATFGPRFVCIDLDCVITGRLEPVWNREEDFVIWGDTNVHTHYNGSMVLMSAGARPRVWTAFDPKVSPTLTFRARQFGSDQAWISYCLGPHEAKWTKDDGVYSYRNQIAPAGPSRLPGNARIVFFHGRTDPWDANGQRLEWVRRHYRAA